MGFELGEFVEIQFAFQTAFDEAVQVGAVVYDTVGRIFSGAGDAPSDFEMAAPVGVDVVGPTVFILGCQARTPDEYYGCEQENTDKYRQHRRGFSRKSAFPASLSTETGKVTRASSSGSMRRIENNTPDQDGLVTIWTPFPAISR